MTRRPYRSGIRLRVSDTLQTAAALGLLLLLSAATGSGADYFVAPGGSDEASGTAPETAFATIRHGAEALRAGDRLTLLPGIYEEAVVVEGLEGTAAAPIVIRAARPGFSILKASRPVSGFTSAAGTRFVGVAPVTEAIYNLFEADSQRLLRRAPSVEDLDEFRGTYIYDADAGRLYVHTTDGRPAAQHRLEVTVLPEAGFRLAGSRHVRVEGLVLQGHAIRTRPGHGYGMRLNSCERVEVRNCTFVNNHGGLDSRDALFCTVRDCLFIGNDDPTYGELAQLYFSKGSVGCAAIDNVVLDAPTHGVRFYAGARDCVARGNIIRNARIGLYFKATGGLRLAENNVAVGASYFNFGTGAGDDPLYVLRNTFARPLWWHHEYLAAPTPDNLIFDAGAEDPRFADPAHLDFRLQADSPFSGLAPGGVDPGAYPVAGNVFFLAPDGDDDADGQSVARAWRTLRHAAGAARPGDTIYLLPGAYAGPLAPARSGVDGRPIVFRGRGERIAVTIRTEAGPALDLSGRSHVVIEALGFEGPGGADLSGAVGVTLEQCLVRATEGSAVGAPGAADIAIRHCLLRSGGESAAVRLSGGERISVTSSILEAPDAPALVIDGPTTGLFLDYNDYAPSEGRPPVSWGGTDYATLAEWRAASGLDGRSLAAPPALADAATGELAATSPLVGAGRLSQSIGPGGVDRDVFTGAVTETTLRQVTPHSASLTFWTPNTSSALWRGDANWRDVHPVLARVEYGTSPACDGGSVESYGDLYHRVTLFDLAPGTTYHARAVLADGSARGETLTFTTPEAEGWRPPARTLHVAPDGSDNADGRTEATAWRTLRHAAEAARAGDTILVHPGVYHETVAPVASGAPGAPITFRAAGPPGSAVLDGSVATETSSPLLLRPTAFLLHGKAHIVIDGFGMRFFAPKHVARRAGMDYGQLVVLGSRDIVMQNCIQHRGDDYGHAAIIKWSRDITLRNNIVAFFVYMWNADDVQNLRIVGNTFYNPTIQTLDITNAEGFLLKNNLFYKAGSSKRTLGLGGVLPEALPENVDYNAWVFPAEHDYKRIERRWHEANAPAGEGYGLEPWRERFGAGAHSLLLDAESVPLAGQGERFLRGQLNKLDDPEDRLRVFDFAVFGLPGDHPLQTAGADGGPIGARAPERSGPAATGGQAR